MNTCLQHSCFGVNTSVGSRKQLAGANLRSAPAPQRAARQQLKCRAHMDIGFLRGQPQIETAEEPKLILEAKDYGLTTAQMGTLGLTRRPVTNPLEKNPEVLSASAFYSPVKVDAHSRQETTMYSGGDTQKPPGQAPPDLPSLLLDGRICFIGMPLVPAVTELVVSELLWLNYNAPDKPVYVYLNSTGSQSEDNEAIAFETEAFAILDTLAYIKPEIHTLVMGQALGNACMILASGKKGCRFSLPNSRMMTAPPRMNRNFGCVSDMMIRANELEFMTQEYVDFMTKFTGRPKESMRKELGRNRWFSPAQGIEYGLIDKIVTPRDRMMEGKNYEAMLKQANAQQSQQRVPAGVSAESGQ